MNPLTIVKNIQKLNDRELELGIIGKKSWHDEYKDSAWVYIGGLPFDLTEGDVICVFSQYGEVVNLNLIRDHKTGKLRGYGFLCYEDQRSTVLAVDNLNGIKILGRTIRVDHVKDYKIPKEFGDEDAVTLKIRNEGCAPQLDSPGAAEVKEETSDEETARKAAKKEKKSKKQKKKKKKKKQRKMDVSSASSLSDSDDNDFKESPHSVEVKKERFDEGYNKALKKESMYKSDSSDSEHSSRDKTYRNGRDRYKYKSSSDSKDRNDSGRDRSDSRRDRNNSSRDKNNSSRDRNDSRDRKDSSRDRNDSSRDRNDSSRDRNEDSRDRHDGGRDRNNSSRDWSERRTDRNDVSRDREHSSRGRNDSSRDRNDSRGERDSSYSQDRYTNNGLQSQDSRFYSSSSSRGSSRPYDNRSTRGRFSDRGGDRYYERGRGRGGRGVGGNFRGQNTFFDDRERRYY